MACFEAGEISKMNTEIEKERTTERMRRTRNNNYNNQSIEQAVKRHAKSAMHWGEAGFLGQYISTNAHIL